MPPLFSTASPGVRNVRHLLVLCAFMVIGWMAFTLVATEGAAAAAPRATWSAKGAVGHRFSRLVNLDSSSAPANDTAANEKQQERDALLKAAAPSADVQPLNASDLAAPFNDTALAAAENATTLEAPAPKASNVSAGVAAIEPLASPALPSDDNISIAFLFLTRTGAVSFPEAWSAFFASADASSFSVVVHRSDNSTEESPAAFAFREACRGRLTLAPHAEGGWGRLIRPSQSLAQAALEADAAAEAFVFLSDTTLPVKSFAAVRAALAERRGRSSLCFNPQAQWQRSQADPASVFPKASQWWTLSRPHAAALAAAAAVAMVDAACGEAIPGRQACYPATSEEMAVATFTGAVPAVAMGSAWLEEHPAPLGSPELDEARTAETAAGPVFGGGPVNNTFPLEGVNDGVLQIRDVGRSNDGDCIQWEWWADWPYTAEREPRFGPQAIFAASLNASSATAVELLLEQHVDQAWLPQYHPQLLGAASMTAEFLHHGLCAHPGTLFARKFDYDFTLRASAWPRNSDGAWACSNTSAWHEAAATESLSGQDCVGFRPAPILGLDTAECAALCCAIDNCAAWSYRGWRSRFEGCWLSSAVSECAAKPEAKAWFGARLINAPPVESAEAARARVVQAFGQCYAEQG